MMILQANKLQVSVAGQEGHVTALLFFFPAVFSRVTINTFAYNVYAQCCLFFLLTSAGQEYIYIYIPLAKHVYSAEPTETYKALFRLMPSQTLHTINAKLLTVHANV